MKSILWSVFFLLFPAHLFAQDVGEQVVRHPRDFQIRTREPGATRAKALYDTLHYTTLPYATSDFVVNSGCGSYGADQHQIITASSPRGGFLCAWNDDRVGDRQVNAQLFDNNGTRVGPVIHVSAGNANWNSEPHITFNLKTNEYIVVWAGEGYDIQLQRISSSGDLVGHNIQANQLSSANSNNPSAATDSSGNIIVTWTADVACCMNVIPYCRILAPDGSPISDQWALDPSGSAPLSSSGWDDRIAADSSGRCIVVWSAHINGRSRIVFQQVNLTGNLSPAPVTVSDPADSTDHIFPTVTSTRDGHFLILWSSNTGIAARIYHPDSGFVSPQFIVTRSSYWMTYGLSSDDRNTFYITWFSDQPYGQLLSTQGHPAGPPSPLVFPSPMAWWDSPRITKPVNGRMYLVYSGTIRMQQDVMLQAFDAAFHPAGSSTKVADDGCSAWQTHPVVRHNRDGKSLIVWDDQRNGYHDLYGQVLDASGRPLSRNFQISDSLLLHRTSAPTIAEDIDGNFLVAFAGGESTIRNLIVQKVSPAGDLLGANLRLTANVYDDYEEMRNAICTTTAGDIIVCWYAGPYAPVYAQRLHTDLTSATASKGVLASTPSAFKFLVGLSVNARGHLLVMWINYDPQTYAYGNALKALVLDESGNIIHDTVMVSGANDGRIFNRGTCRIDNEDNLLFVWSDYDTQGYENRMHVKRLYESGGVDADSVSIANENMRMDIVAFADRQALVAWDSYTEIHSVLYNDNFQTYSAMNLHTFDSFVYSLGGWHNGFDADTYKSTLLFGYESSHDADLGYDIYANVQRLDALGLQYVPASFESTSPVFPNPSAQTARLTYSITQQTHVTIGVYNILGQRIGDVEDAVRGPGLYTVQYPTVHLAAGTYFFLFQGAKTYAQKFLVIK